MILNKTTDQHGVVLDFIVFLINRLARAWGKTTPDTYEILERSGVLGEYILPNWEVLHSEGTEALLQDVTECVRRRGAVL